MRSYFLEEMLDRLDGEDVRFEPPNYALAEQYARSEPPNYALAAVGSKGFVMFEDVATPTDLETLGVFQALQGATNQALQALAEDRGVPTPALLTVNGCIDGNTMQAIRTVGFGFPETNPRRVQLHSLTANDVRTTAVNAKLIKAALGFGATAALPADITTACPIARQFIEDPSSIPGGAKIEEVKEPGSGKVLAVGLGIAAALIGAVWLAGE